MISTGNREANMCAARPKAGRSYLLRLIFLISIGLASAHSAHAESRHLQLGAYVWGGLLAQGNGIERFHRSISFLLDRGFTAIRFSLSPDARSQYGLDNPQICNNEQQAACYLRIMLDSANFDDPRLSLLVITLHDFTSSSFGILDPDKLHTQRQEIISEYEASFEVLYQRFKGRSVRVILTNWEGDNMTHCGSVYSYATDRNFAARCDALYAKSTSAGLLRTDALLEWIAIRDDAIASFFTKHKDFHLQQAPELNNINLFGQECTDRCELRDSLIERFSRFHRSLCSYSAWDSTGHKSLRDDLRKITSACDEVLIGEIGSPIRNGKMEQADADYRTWAADLQKYSGLIVGVIVWNAFYDPARDAADCGLFLQDGTPHLVSALSPLFALTVAISARPARSDQK